jgi:hypothetical protein
MYEIVVLALLVVGSTAPLEAAAPPATKFCVGTNAESFRLSEASCTEVQDLDGVTAEPNLLFLSKSAETNEFRVGKTGSHPITSSGLMAVTFRLHSDSPVWPRAIRFRVERATAASQSWEWSVSANDAERPTTVYLPREDYLLSVTADHHAKMSMALKAPRDGSRLALGSLELEAMPMVQGLTVDKDTGEALAGVLIQLPSGRTLTTTDALGEFREFLPSDEPADSLLLIQSGFGTKAIPLPMGSVIDMGRIELSRAGKLRILVSERDDYSFLTIELMRKDGRKREQIATKELPGSEWTFDDLDPGEYVITLAGKESLQQFSTEASVRAAETTEVSLRINPIDLVGVVTRQGKGLPEAQLAIRASPFGWTATVHTDERGEFQEELWQSARFVVTITSRQLSAPYMFIDEIKEFGGSARWHIRIPSGTITGLVTSKGTNQPIENAEVTLDSELSEKDATQSLGARTDSLGTFAFEGTEAGLHVITVQASGYAPARSEPLVITGDDEHRQVDISLAQAGKQTITVSSVTGLPIADAVVVHDLLPPGFVPRTGADGRVTIDLDGSWRNLLLVLPENGSFAILPGGQVRDPDEVVQIVVTPGVGAISVEVSDERTGTPVPGVNVLVRYNGLFLPPRLVTFAERTLGALRTDGTGRVLFAALPAGQYELWVYGSHQEAARIMQGGIRPAAALTVGSGLQTVRVFLQREP